MQFLSIMAVIIWPAYPSASEKLESDVIHPQSGIFRDDGVYETRKGKCDVSLQVSGMGGHTLLLLPSRAPQKQEIEDVSGVAYRSNDTLIFTVSPIYGKPGIFVYDCMSKLKKQIVKPHTINEAYPDGADFFELQEIRENTIYFYYAPDVDSVDFTKFRNQGSLYAVNIDGSGFSRAAE